MLRKCFDCQNPMRGVLRVEEVEVNRNLSSDHILIENYLGSPRIISLKVNLVFSDYET